MAVRVGNRNAASRVQDDSPGPWMQWEETDRAERAIRFIEEYCIVPKGYGARKPMKLAPFQKAWIRRVLRDGISSACMQVARGNGKSSLLAALAIWAVFDPDETGAPQVPIVATTVNQAVRSVYGVALSMIRTSPALSSRCIIYSAIGAMKVLVPFTGGEMFPVSNDVEGLQGLDPSLAVCDEAGFMALDSWNSLLLAGIKRPRSLVVGIGTPGLDHDNALWHLRKLHTDGATPPGFDFTEYSATEGCDINDEEEWKKANPAIEAGFLNEEVMRTNLALAPEGRFRIFHLSQWVDGVESWLGPDGRKIWNALTDRYQFVLGAPTWVGVDVGLKRDSTAVVVIQRRDEKRLHAKCKLWVPSDDEPVDVTDVMQYLRQLDSMYDLQEVPYDPRLFDVPAKMLEDEGLPMVEIPQSAERMTPAFGTLFEMIKRSELSHDGDVEFTAQILNAVPRFNERGFTLAKAKSRGRIDAAYALATAVDRAMHAKPKRAPLVCL